MAQKVVKNLKLTVDELQTFSKEELIARFIQIQEHNVQLKNILSKLQNEGKTSAKKTSVKRVREFDFTKWGSTHVFIRFLYLGWNYQGYATVEDTIQTVEHQVMEALMKCRLIKSRETAEYHRCGRTDKGVSAFNQVISLKVREGKNGTELDYCGMLNRLLPPDIRVTGWCRVSPQASARFNCTTRVYRYYFPKANLDIAAMKDAAFLLKGVHDFRNLCKMDVANGVTTFTRKIIDANILPLISDTNDSENSGYHMYEFKVIGSGFLWHQIRCIMAVLLMVGQHQEDPKIISELLDVQKHPKKPQYTLASEVGLCLFNTEYDIQTPWSIDKEEMTSVVSLLQGLWSTYAIKTEQIRSMLRNLESDLDTEILYNQADILVGTKRPRHHQPLLSRNTCHSLEERVEHYRKKLKISAGNDDDSVVTCFDEEDLGPSVLSYKDVKS